MTKNRIKGNVLKIRYKLACIDYSKVIFNGNNCEVVSDHYGVEVELLEL